MITFLAALIGTTGCVDEYATKYGIPHDDNTTYDEDILDDDAGDIVDEDEISDADVIPTTDDMGQPEYGIPPTDYDTSDKDIVEDPDDMGQPEYGVTPTDYDTNDSDVIEVPDEPAMEYGPVKTDYDENPDEMTTDYGPISTKYEK